MSTVTFEDLKTKLPAGVWQQLAAARDTAYAIAVTEPPQSEQAKYAVEVEEDLPSVAEVEALAQLRTERLRAKNNLSDNKTSLAQDMDRLLGKAVISHINVAPVQSIEKSDLDMPKNCMYGILGELAYELHSPMGWAYCALTTIFAGKGINLGDPAPVTSPTLYTVLLGDVQSGKSIVFRRAAQVLGMHGTQNFVLATPASDRGLFSLFGEKVKNGELSPGLTSATLGCDEFIELLTKAGYQGSALAPLLCHLWSYRNKIHADKQGKYELNVQLSILGNLPAADPAKFSSLMGVATTDGLYSRLVIVPGQTGWTFAMNWKPNVVELIPWPTKISEEGYTRIDEYRAKRTAAGIKTGRLLEIAQRVALITASANQESVVSEACLEAAFRFMEWQERVREVYKASEAENPEAKVAGAVIDAFRHVEVEYAAGRAVLNGTREIVKPGGWVSWKLISEQKNWSRKHSPSMMMRIRSSMIQLGDLIEQKDDKGKPTGLYRLGAQHMGAQNTPKQGGEVHED